MILFKDIDFSKAETFAINYISTALKKEENVKKLQSFIYNNFNKKEITYDVLDSSYFYYIYDESNRNCMAVCVNNERFLINTIRFYIYLMKDEAKLNNTIYNDLINLLYLPFVEKGLEKTRYTQAISYNDTIYIYISNSIRYSETLKELNEYITDLFKSTGVFDKVEISMLSKEPDHKDYYDTIKIYIDDFVDLFKESSFYKKAEKKKEKFETNTLKGIKETLDFISELFNI